MKRNFHSVGVLALAISAASVVAGQTARAQETGASLRTARAASPTTVTEVIVTAERREEPLSKVPVSVSAVTAKEMEALGAKDIESVSRTVPGLDFVTGGLNGTQQISIRGISGTPGTLNTTNTIGVYIDDTPITQPIGLTAYARPKLFDIDRIEVLRGPQGTLYGASAEGGAIRYITTAPSLTTMSGEVRAELADTEDGAPSYELGAAIGGPIISDRLGFRASLWGRRDGGYIDDVSRLTGETVNKDINHEDSYAGRLALLFAPTDRLSITAAVYAQDTRTGAPAVFYQGSAAFPFYGDYRTGSVDAQTQKDGFYLPSLKIVYDFGPASLTSVTSYFHRTFEENVDYSTLVPELLFHTFDIAGFENYDSTHHIEAREENISQELRLTSEGTGRLQYTAGFFYQHSEFDLDDQLHDNTIENLFLTKFGVGVQTLLGEGLLNGNETFIGVNRSTLIEKAGFVDFRYSLTSALKLIGGVRVSGIDTKFFRFTDGPLNGGPKTVPLTTVSETSVSPRFGVSYQIGDTMLYATTAKGFRPGGTNGVIPEEACAADLANAGQAGPPASYKSDSVWSYEAGSKGHWFENRLQVNADVYYIKWRNIQQSLNLPTCGFAYEANLGSATSKGTEVEIEAQVTNDLNVGLNVGYDDARFDNGVLGGKNPNTGVAAVLTRAGDRIIYVPDWTLSAHAQFQHEVAPSYLGYLRVDYQYRGKYANTTGPGTANFDAATFDGPAYDVLNLRVGVRHRSVDVSLFMNNALDASPVTSLNDQLVPVTKAPLFITTLRPRTFGITATGTF